MKSITLDVTEVVTYRRAYTVGDDFDVTDSSAVESLFTEDEDAITEGFVAVLERDITVRDTAEVLFGSGGATR